MFLDGQKIAKRTTLAHASVIVIGDTSLVLIDTLRQGRTAKTIETLAPSPLAASTRRTSPPPTGETVTGVSLSALALRVSSALADTDDQLASSARLLFDHLSAMGYVGDPALNDALALGTRAALRLARARRDGSWLDRLLDANGAYARLLDRVSVDELQHAALGLGGYSGSACARYVSRLGARRRALEGEDVNTLRRLEAMCRALGAEIA